MKIFAIKQGGIIKRQMLPILLLLIFGSSQLVWGQEVVRNVIEINSPKNGDKFSRNVDNSIEVKGTAKIHNEDKSNEIWIWVHSEHSNPQCIPHSKASVSKEGNWRSFIYKSKLEHKDIDFKIKAATFNKDIAVKIRKAYNNEIKIDFPKTTSNIPIVSIRIE